MEMDPLLLKASAGFALVLAAAAWMPSPDTGSPTQAPSQAQADAESDGIDVALQDFESVRTSGSAVDRCTRAHAVALAYLRAEDRAGYQTWETLGEQNCAAAGFQAESETAALPHVQGLSSSTSGSSIVVPRGGGT
jgi:hypothetical protein